MLGFMVAIKRQTVKLHTQFGNNSEVWHGMWRMPARHLKLHTAAPHSQRCTAVRPMSTADVPKLPCHIKRRAHATCTFKRRSFKQCRKQLAALLRQLTQPIHVQMHSALNYIATNDGAHVKARTQQTSQSICTELLW